MWRVPDIIAALFLAGTSWAAAQTGPGPEISGRMTDRAGGALPGVQVTISRDAESTKVVTDSDGRFAVKASNFATYQVTAQLAGFRTVSGSVAVSAQTPRAVLAWSLEVGCLEEDVRVIFSAREAAPLVEKILHVRVLAANGQAQLSDRPDCPGRKWASYSVEVLNRSAGPAQLAGRPMEMFLTMREPILERGREYLALLWPGNRAADQLVLPVDAGQVSLTAGGGWMRVDQALETLAQWAKAKRDRPSASR